MDKTALQLKKKRKQIKEEIKKQKINKTWDDINKYARDSGHNELTKSSKKMLEVYRIRKSIDNKILTKCSVIALLCSIKVINKKFNLNTHQIIEFAEKLKRFIITIGNNNRDLNMLLDDFNRDYGVSILDKCKDLPQLNSNEVRTNNMDDVIIKSTTDNFPYLLCITLTTFMNYMLMSHKKVWNKVDIVIFVDNVLSIYKSILLNTSQLQVVHNELINECKIHVNLDNGNITELI